MDSDDTKVPADCREIQDGIAELREAIARAFPVEPVPDRGELIGHECEECWGVRDTFSELQWVDVPAQAIDANYGTLPLLIPSALCYYLPAYLLRSFTKECFSYGGSDVTDFTIYQLCPDDESRWREQYAGFSDEQLQVAGRWLAFVLQHDGIFDPDRAVGEPGFEKYWRRYVG